MHTKNEVIVIPSFSDNSLDNIFSPCLIRETMAYKQCTYLHMWIYMYILMFVFFLYTTLSVLLIG